jgi:hypothetical protein
MEEGAPLRTWVEAGPGAAVNFLSVPFQPSASRKALGRPGTEGLPLRLAAGQSETHRRVPRTDPRRNGIQWA